MGFKMDHLHIHAQLLVSYGSALSLMLYFHAFFALCTAALGSVLNSPIKLLEELLLNMLVCREGRDHRNEGSSSFKIKVCLC